MLPAFLAVMAPDAGLALPWLAEITYPQIDPVLVSIGPIPIRWYSLAYIAGLVLGYLWVRSSLPRTKTITARAVDDLFLWIIVGVVAGGRLGSVLFYGLQREPERYLSDPIAWVSVWDGGMSFHGGFIGVVLAVILWSRFNPRTNYWEISDLLAISAPIGLFFGRIANFINAELYGRPTDVAWAMRFPVYGRDREIIGFTEPRHPSQLYEAALEGIVLFIALNLLWRNPGIRARAGVVTGGFMAGYGIFRFLVEFVRKPDNGLEAGLLKFGGLGTFTTGQELSVPMIIVGVALILWRRNSPAPGAAPAPTPKAKPKSKAKSKTD